MSAFSRRLLFWAPRALGIAFALLISMFALDVFGEGYGFWNTLLALAMHLIPTAIVVAVLLLAWRWEWIGALLFAAVGMFYVVTTWRHPDWILMISGPLFLIAVLFLIGWLKRAELHSRPLGH
ncbi:MAG: hypothetical protein LAP39_13865 [Acidobacteriia bacterium]|nr:hypothetical protein [Terriglobia bacterium]